jgi:hypothetical protein
LGIPIAVGLDEDKVLAALDGGNSSDKAGFFFFFCGSRCWVGFVCAGGEEEVEKEDE